ncbi:AraC family transcriptional regulator [Hephaestia sp. GCM10023244]|uniref:helix-turn-helix transcriptional regulator n=1 Tax=unclassified Hephaestia TaxID=2631281 RepID=UPI0020778FCF|nr:AraC family transcriptional regulator [Hephaestia sp. MAHUQ-44]MCM8730891.1 AraC family transcriptional regulator [Hephaestia sp. MAHUQ-44]
MNSAYLSHRLSTASVPMRDRLSMWREVFGQAMARLDIEAVGDAPFHAEGTLCALPGAAYASVLASPVRVARTRGLIAADSAEMIYLITADAPVEVVQNGQERVLATGDAIFLRGGEVSSILSDGPNRFTNIAVALNDLRALYAGADDLAMRVVPRQSDLLGLLHGYVDMLRMRGDAALKGAEPLAAGHIRDLIGAIAAQDDGAGIEEAGVKAARRRAIKADIAARLCDSRLNITAVAAKAGISPRYVRRLFQDEGSSFSAYILGQRLERAHRLILHPGPAPRTIAAIAYACGFGDLSYFNRTFRQRFAMTPSDLRGGMGAA